MEIIFSHGVKVRGITEDIEMQLRNKTVVIHSLHGFMKPHDFVSSEEREGRRRCKIATYVWEGLDYMLNYGDECL